MGLELGDSDCCLDADTLMEKETLDSVGVSDDATRVSIAYLITEYPSVSHAFIRREIQALESLGVPVNRFAVRGWKAVTIEEGDVQESTRTTYLLQAGALRLINSVLFMIVKRPMRLAQTFIRATQLGIRAERSLIYHWFYFVEACHFAKLINERAIKHVHAHFGNNATEVGMLAAKLAGVTFSFTAHGTVETDNPNFNGIAAKASAASFVVAVSQYGRAQILRWTELDVWPRIHVVHCGVDAGFLDGPRSTLEDSERFLIVGRLSPEKGQLVAIDALAELLTSGRNAFLDLIGDGPMRQTLDERVAAKGLRERVRFLGWKSSKEIRHHLQESRALVLPSFAEGLPVVLMEAMAARRPVIASHVGGVPELVETNHTGWLVAPGDKSSLARAMSDCLDTSLPKLAAMGEAGRLRVESEFDVERSARELRSLFRELK